MGAVMAFCIEVTVLDLARKALTMGLSTQPSRKSPLMNKAPTWLRTTLSIPVYAVSVVVWIFTVYMFVTTVKTLSAFMTPEQIGEKLFDFFLVVVLATVGNGLWMLGRYIRTSKFRKQPKLATASLP